MGMGPPPPGTLLGTVEPVVDALRCGLPAKAAATRKASAEMRMAIFIRESPL
jgi:hypothetical protein